MRSPISLTGSKHYQAPWIIDNFPKHKVYVEVFGGGAHVLIQKNSSKVEIYNDINNDLVNFLLIARNQPEELFLACDSLPVSRSLYEKWKWEDGPEDDFEKAVRWFYIMRQSFGGLQKYKSGWRTTKDRNVANIYHLACELIKAVSERFKYVVIENDDFRNIIERYDSPDTLFYCDPPYSQLEHYYKGDFEEKDHRDLANMLNNIKGKAIVSYYDDRLINELYSDWGRETKEYTKYAGYNRDKGEEILFMNYQKKMSLF